MLFISTLCCSCSLTWRSLVFCSVVAPGIERLQIPISAVAICTVEYRQNLAMYNLQSATNLLTFCYFAHAGICRKHRSERAQRHPAHQEHHRLLYMWSRTSCWHLDVWGYSARHAEWQWAHSEGLDEVDPAGDGSALVSMYNTIHHNI